VRYYNDHTTLVKQALIALRKIQGLKMAESIFETLQSVLYDRNISMADVSYYVTDNGSNIIKAMKDCVVTMISSAKITKVTSRRMSWKNAAVWLTGALGWLAYSGALQLAMPRNCFKKYHRRFGAYRWVSGSKYDQELALAYAQGQRVKDRSPLLK